MRKVTQAQVLLTELPELDPNYIPMLVRELRQPTLFTIFKIGTVPNIAPSEIVRQLKSTVPWLKEWIGNKIRPSPYHYSLLVGALYQFAI